jgi:tRNA-dihydrouridine synthase 1
MMGTQVNNDVNLDRPLILQLGSSNIEKLLQAIELAVDLKDPNTGDVMIDAVELNCGCPQRCAKKGNYGSFLLDPPRQDILLNIIRTIRQSNVLPSSIPLLVKMRVLEGIPETVHLAKCIVEAGAGLLTVHGRTRYQGGGSKTVGRDQVNLASWPHIRAVKQAVPVPVIANGNVPGKPALKEVLEATGCDGVMSGVGILRDPTLFENPDNISVNLTDMAEDGKTQNQHDNDAWNRAVHVACEYIDLAILYQTLPVRVQKHLTWMLDGKGFKNRAPVARQQTLDLKFVKPGDGSDSGGNEDSNDGNRSNETVDWCAEDGNNGVPISNAGEVADVLTCLKKELQESLLSDAHAKTGDY